MFKPRNRRGIAHVTERNLSARLNVPIQVFVTGRGTPLEDAHASTILAIVR